MAPNIPWWSISNWYVWLPFWLFICGPGLVIVAKVIKDNYQMRRDRILLKDGIISLNEYRRRRGGVKV